jgi:hypothetical protein
MAHNCNPSYSGGRDQKDQVSLQGQPRQKVSETNKPSVVVHTHPGEGKSLLLKSQKFSIGAAHQEEGMGQEKQARDSCKPRLQP